MRQTNGTTLQVLGSPTSHLSQRWEVLYFTWNPKQAIELALEHRKSDHRAMRVVKDGKIVWQRGEWI